MSAKRKSYTIAQAAKKLRISRQAVSRAIKKGQIKAQLEKVETRIWRIPAKSIEGYQPSRSHQDRGKKND
jgi:excisionase family DNA binding protein